MRFGVMMHKTTQNIGDDIQTFAAARLLPEVSYFLDRESLDRFETDDGEAAAVVMSAWYMWHKWNWPPSKYVLPLFVGMHYTDNETAKQDGSPVKTEFLTGLGKEYMNAFSPIGCRDSFTEETFKQLGIDCYFSGCITLTLPRMPRTEDEGGYICCSDVSDEVCGRAEKLLEGTGIELRRIRHYKDYRNSDATWEERAKNVTDLLTVYQNAKCVITRRLHCALPCLAMGVPVLVINDEKAGSLIRFEPYYDWLHNCTAAEFISGECGFDLLAPPENSSAYLPYREKLLQTVAEFVDKYKDAHISAEENARFGEDEIREWRHDVMKDCMDRWLYVTRGHINSNARLEKKKAELSAELRDTKKELSAERKSLKQMTERAQAQQKRAEKSESECERLSHRLSECERELAHLRSVVSCKSVRYSIAARNLFVGKKKKIRVD